MSVSLGPDGQALSVQLRDVWLGWRVPMEDIALLVVQAAVSSGRGEASVEVPAGIEPADYQRAIELLAARGWHAVHVPPAAAACGAPGIVTFVQRCGA